MSTGRERHHRPWWRGVEREQPLNQRMGRSDLLLVEAIGGHAQGISLDRVKRERICAVKPGEQTGDA